MVLGPEEGVLLRTDLVLDDVEELGVPVSLGEQVLGALLALVDQGQEEEGAHGVDECLRCF